MSTRAKKTRLSLSLDPDLVGKLSEAAEADYGGNVSRLVTAVLWREFLPDGSRISGKQKTAGGKKDAAGAPAPGAEIDQCHRLLLRLWKERRLPAWVTLERGEISVDGQVFSYVKKWRLDASTAETPSGEIVEALTRWGAKARKHP